MVCVDIVNDSIAQSSAVPADHCASCAGVMLAIRLCAMADSLDPNRFTNSVSQ